MPVTKMKMKTSTLLINATKFTITWCAIGAIACLISVALVWSAWTIFAYLT